jgi:hypothetical protein
MLAMLITPILQTFAAAPCTKTTFLGLVPWYQFLDLAQDVNGRCAVTNFNPSSPGGVQPTLLGSNSALLRIGLAIVDDLIRVAAFVAVGYIIYGGILYMTSQGAPDMTKKGQQTIINALIGLVTAIMAASIVTFIGNKLGNA